MNLQNFHNVNESNFTVDLEHFRHHDYKWKNQVSGII